MPGFACEMLTLTAEADSEETGAILSMMNFFQGSGRLAFGTSTRLKASAKNQKRVMAPWVTLGATFDTEGSGIVEVHHLPNGSEVLLVGQLETADDVAEFGVGVLASDGGLESVHTRAELLQVFRREMLPRGRGRVEVPACHSLCNRRPQTWSVASWSARPTVVGYVLRRWIVPRLGETRVGLSHVRLLHRRGRVWPRDRVLVFLNGLVVQTEEWVCREPQRLARICKVLRLEVTTVFPQRDVLAHHLELDVVHGGAVYAHGVPNLGQV